VSKRANGEGTVAKRARGGWEAKLTYEDPETGQRRRASFYAPTAKAARAKMNAARERIAEGAPVRDAKRSVGDWLAHWRATSLAASDRKESTQALYATLCRGHLEPAPFGLIPLDRLRPSDVEALVLAMRRKTKPGPKDADGKPGDPVRGLSDSTIRQVYTVLRAGLDGAVRDGLLARNPAALVKRPGVERQEAKHLDAAVVAMLRRHAITQKEDRLRAGSEWVDSGLVFTNEFGGPVEPRNLLRVIEVAAKAAGVEGIGVHTLRHSAAVAWLEAGVHIKAVADLLGHSSIAITGDVYGHTSEDTARAAVDGLAGRLGL
jgi:integrase